MRSATRRMRGFVTAAVMATSGCFRSLPPPTLRQATLPAEESYEKLCAADLKRAEFLIHEQSPLSGIVECGADHATIVLFNSLQVRVRTTTVSQTGTLRDEISFLCPNKDSAEFLISEIGAALDLTSTEPKRDTPYLTITTWEPLRPARNR